MGLIASFAHYEANLTNPNWSVSAFAPDGSLILSLWQPYLKKGHGQFEGTLVFERRVSQWMEGSSGKQEVLDHLERAHQRGAKVKLVLLHPKSEDRDKVGTVADERKIPKEYSTPDFVGVIDHFDGDTIRILFRLAG